MKKKVIVTGGGGQLATCIQAVDDGALKYHFCSIAEMDITEVSQVEQQLHGIRPDVMINCAAYTAVDRAENETALADKINKEALNVLAQACNKYQVKLVHISTDFVYDDTEPQLKKETSPTNPLGQYAASKLEGEDIVRDTCKNYLIIRTSWLYSCGGRPVRDTDPCLGFGRRTAADHIPSPFCERKRDVQL
jgi:dTDP-4-dehydrorhamnose reductase